MSALTTPVRVLLYSLAAGWCLIWWAFSVHQSYRLQVGCVFAILACGAAQGLWARRAGTFVILMLCFLSISIASYFLL